MGPEDKSKWNPIWKHCYSIWEKSPYTIKLWNDSQIDNEIKQDDPEFFKLINQLSPIYKYDFVRYIILKKYPGAYFDLDVEIINDFFPLLDVSKNYIVEGEMNDIVSNFIMISSKKQNRLWQFLKNKSKYNLIQNFQKSKNDIHNVVEYVGPVFLSKFVAKYRPPIDILSFNHFGSMNNGISFCKHHYTNSWN